MSRFRISWEKVFPCVIGFSRKKFFGSFEQCILILPAFVVSILLCAVLFFIACDVWSIKVEKTDLELVSTVSILVAFPTAFIITFCTSFFMRIVCDVVSWIAVGITMLLHVLWTAFERHVLGKGLSLC